MIEVITVHIADDYLTDGWLINEWRHQFCRLINSHLNGLNMINRHGGNHHERQVEKSATVFPGQLAPWAPLGPLGHRITMLLKTS